MHARKVSHKILSNSLLWIHKTGLAALDECVLAAIEGRRLSVTGLGPPHVKIVVASIEL